MRVSPFGPALLAIVISSHAVRAEECTKRQAQAEQIECLQRTVESLEQQLALLTTRLATYDALASSLRTAGETSLDRMIDEKIRKALEPRLQLLPDQR